MIGPSRTAPGLWHAFGFSGHGFQLGPIIGSVLADLILEGATSIPIDAFSPTRFTADGKLKPRTNLVPADA